MIEWFCLRFIPLNDYRIYIRHTFRSGALPRVFCRYTETGPDVATAARENAMPQVSANFPQPARTGERLRGRVRLRTFAGNFGESPE